MTSFKVRDATLSDVAVLADLAHELNLFHGDSSRPAPDDLRADWGRYEAYLIEADGRPVGFLAGYDAYQFHKGLARYELQNLYVKEALRGSGAARILLAAVVGRKVRQGIQKFSLAVEADNPAAIAFYEKLGFSRRPTDAIRYALFGPALAALTADCPAIAISS